MRSDLSTQLNDAHTFADIFEVVKAAVLKHMGKSRGGLMLGMANLGNSPKAFLGGFHSVGSNVIVMNKIPLQRINETRPELSKPYAFHVLMHEYLHTFGILDENLVKSKVQDITRAALGDDHLATMIANDTKCFFNHLVYPEYSWKPDDGGIEIIKDFDRSSVCYIA
jgi:hypothetical protein